MNGVNILFHMFLSGSDPDLLVGNFMGDFVKGPLGASYPPGILQGLILHRRIDSFAQKDGSFQTSRLRLPEQYGLYRGVLVDLFYDHFLASEWDTRSGREFVGYLHWARQSIEKRRPLMSPHLQGLIPVIFDELLPSYATTCGIETALSRMSRRLKRANPLAAGGAELTRHYAGLQEDFAAFTPAVQRFVAGIIA